MNEIIIVLLVVIFLFCMAMAFFIISGLRRDVSNLQNTLATSISESFDKNQQSVFQQLSESSKLINDVSARLTKLDETNKTVLSATDELKNLQNILLNPKQRGNFGEFQLNSILENAFPPTQWQAQYLFQNGERVDAVLFLKEKQMLAIDSKFSLENYNKMLGETNHEKKSALAKLVRNDLKNRIDETSKYIRPAENTLDFAFMFIPSEALYYDLLIAKVGDKESSERDLIEYAYRDKKVIIVSPTTFVAYLQTVLQGLRSLKIEEQAKDIQKRVALLGNHLQQFDAYMQSLGKSLGTTVNHFNHAHKELSKVDKDVVKITGSEEKVVALELDKPTSLAD
jgi:DNA recombination protein RmuC